MFLAAERLERDKAGPEVTTLNLTVSTRSANRRPATSALVPAGFQYQSFADPLPQMATQSLKSTSERSHKKGDIGSAHEEKPEKKLYAEEESVNVERIENNISLFQDDSAIKKLASSLKTREQRLMDQLCVADLHRDSQQPTRDEGSISQASKTEQQRGPFE